MYKKLLKVKVLIGRLIYKKLVNILLCEARVKFFRKLLLIPAAVSISVPVAADINFGKENSNLKQHQIVQEVKSDGYLISEANPESRIEDSDSLEITVTGTRNEKFVDDVPASIKVIDIQDAKIKGASELKDVLRYETGVSVEEIKKGGYAPGAASEGNVNIRGLDKNRVLFLQDGIRLPSDFGDSLSYKYGRGDYVDFNTLKSVEILKGPGSTLYGSDALGGILSYRSIEAKDLLEAGESFSVEIPINYTGYNAGKNGAIKIAAQDESSGFSAIGVFSILDSSETKPKDFESRDEWINTVDKDGQTFYINAEKELDETKKIGIIFEKLNRNSEIKRGAKAIAYENSRTLVYSQKNRDLEVEKDKLVISYEYKNGEVDKIINSFTAKAYLQNSKIDDTWDDKLVSRGTPQHRVSDYQLKDDAFGVDLQFGKDLNGNKLTWGIDFSNSNNEYLQNRDTTTLSSGVVTPDNKKRVPDSETKRLGLYVQDEVTLGDIDFTAGLRFDSYDVSISRDNLFNNYCSVGGTMTCSVGELETSSVTPKLGAIYDVNDNVSLYGQYSKGFRAPTWGELNYVQNNLAMRYQILSNPDLKAEKSDSFEIGLRGNSDRNQFRLATFYNTYEDFIAIESTTQTVNGMRGILVQKPVNKTEAEIFGLELNNEFKISEGSNGNLTLINSATYLKGNDTTENEALPDIDPFKAVTGLRYTTSDKKWTTELIATFVGKARVADSNKKVTSRGRTTEYYHPDAYTVFDAITKYDVSDSFNVDLGIYNLTDNRYYKYQNTLSNGVSNTVSNLERYSEPGRSVKAGFNFKF